MFGSGRLSPVRTRSFLTLFVEAITAAVSRIIQPVIAMAFVTVPTMTMVLGSLYLCRLEPWMLEFEHS